MSYVIIQHVLKDFMYSVEKVFGSYDNSEEAEDKKEQLESQCFTDGGDSKTIVVKLVLGYLTG